MTKKKEKKRKRKEAAFPSASPYVNRLIESAEDHETGITYTVTRPFIPLQLQGTCQIAGILYQKQVYKMNSICNILQKIDIHPQDHFSFLNVMMNAPLIWVEVAI